MFLTLENMKNEINNFLLHKCLVRCGYFRTKNDIFRHLADTANRFELFVRIKGWESDKGWRVTVTADTFGSSNENV